MQKAAPVLPLWATNSFLGAQGRHLEGRSASEQPVRPWRAAEPCTPCPGEQEGPVGGAGVGWTAKPGGILRTLLLRLVQKTDTQTAVLMQHCAWQCGRQGCVKDVNMRQSQELFAFECASMPGGVDVPARACLCGHTCPARACLRVCVRIPMRAGARLCVSEYTDLSVHISVFYPGEERVGILRRSTPL